jgi:hypothetical protein
MKIMDDDWLLEFILGRIAMLPDLFALFEFVLFEYVGNDLMGKSVKISPVFFESINPHI